MKKILIIISLSILIVGCGGEEKDYVTNVNTWLDRHSSITTEQNNVLEKLAPLLRSGDEDAFLSLYQTLSNNRLEIQANCNSFRDFNPPKKYIDTHIIMANACGDIMEASNTWVTVFSMILKGETPSDSTMNNGRQLLRNYNQARTEFVYKYRELSGQN